jgi:outer membrane autotransporter protein
LAFLAPHLSYDPQAVAVVMQRNDVGFGKAGASANQMAGGAVVEALGAGNPLYDAVLWLTRPEAQSAFDQLSGEVHASAKGVLLEDSRFVRDAVAGRLRAAFDGVGATTLPLMAYGEGGPQLAPADTQRFAAWGSTFGSWENTDGDGNAASLKHSTGGFLMGADGEVFETWRLGLMAGYSHSSFQVHDRAASGSSDNYDLGAYAGTQWGNLGFRSGLAYSWHDLAAGRAVGFPGFSDNLTSNYRAGTFQAFGELGYRIDTASVAFEPFANLAYVNLHTGSFAEQGGAAALTSASQTTDTTFTTLGLRASTNFELAGMQVTARGMLGWRHASNAVPFATHSFAGGDSFTVAGTSIARDAAVLEAGLDLEITPAAMLGVSYSGQIASSAQDHGFNAKLKLSF